MGAFIEDKNSGTILLQQALRRGMAAAAIDSKLTAMGKDERALNVSGYIYRGEVMYTDHAFNKVSTYKRRTKNHLTDQIESVGWVTRTTSGTTTFSTPSVTAWRWRSATLGASEPPAATAVSIITFAVRTRRVVLRAAVRFKKRLFR
jgi:hypothetical protein